MTKFTTHSSSDSEGRLAIWKLAGYVVATIFVSCIAMLVNVGLVYALYSGIAQFAIKETYSKQLGQFVLLLGPFLLLFPEWLLYDLLTTPFRKNR
ncbi:MAG: hypothetical protein SGI77_10215 [Pirellulaceae bacterium]|nr:hypothetical protein [Pirellulaceae bacterium]